jgi:hypothetical protein
MSDNTVNQFEEQYEYTHRSAFRQSLPAGGRSTSWRNRNPAGATGRRSRSLGGGCFVSRSAEVPRVTSGSVSGATWSKVSSSAVSGLLPARWRRLTSCFTWAPTTRSRSRESSIELCVSPARMRPPRSLLKMPASVRAVIAATGPEVADRKGVRWLERGRDRDRPGWSPAWVRPGPRHRRGGQGQASAAGAG